ncbi:yippee family protein [Rutstroemia sp. NJR-2017a WRK4]|nr:yippee family protein [Rutstroemia sp. NJR-2017a WRK4]
MPSSNDRLMFPSYLIPSFSFPFRRQQSAAPPDPSTTVPALSYSPTSSCGTSPIVSPTSDSFPSQFTYKDQDQDFSLYPSNPLSSRTPPRSSSAKLSRPHPDTLRFSKGFTGRHGRAYLVAPPPPEATPVIPPFPPKKIDKSKNLTNTRIGRFVNRELLTGHHVVADVNCAVCNSLLGWKYVDAKEAGQRYKIGKFILETKRVMSVGCWEDEGVSKSNAWDDEDDGIQTKEDEEETGFVVFDSEDEEECEELFAGTWDAETVQKRRIRRVDRRKREASKDSGIAGL